MAFILLLTVVLLVWLPVAYTHIKHYLDGTYVEWSKTTAPVAQEYRFYYRGNEYKFYAVDTADALNQVRANLSATAAREAVLLP